MNNLVGQPGEVRFTVTIKRAKTGKEETYDMVGSADPEKLKQIIENIPSNEQPKEQQ